MNLGDKLHVNSHQAIVLPRNIIGGDRFFLVFSTKSMQLRLNYTHCVHAEYQKTINISSNSSKIYIYTKQFLKEAGLDSDDYDFIISDTNMQGIIIDVVKKQAVFDDLDDDLDELSVLDEEQVDQRDFKVGMPVLIKGTISHLNNGGDVFEVLIEGHKRTKSIMLKSKDIKINTDLPSPGYHLMGIDGSMFLVIACEDVDYPIGIVNISSHILIDKFSSIEIAMDELNLEVI